MSQFWRFTYCWICFVSLALLTELVTADTVCVVGAGTIGASFAGVFLAKGKSVVCVDAWVNRELVEERIRSNWPTLQARGFASKRSSPDFSKLILESTVEDCFANHQVDHVQECVFEDIDIKQQVLQKLDQVVPESTIIASSTSYIPLSLLTIKCKVNKDRIVIAHPSIPHIGSFLELCGSNPENVAAAKEWYTNSGFDCITMNKTIFGHVWNSFLTLNMRHGEKLIQSGVCSPEDVNQVLRHLGREFYARQIFLSLFLTVGGDRGLEGGLELRERVAKGAVTIVFTSLFHRIPGAKWIGKGLSKLLTGSVAPAPSQDYLAACQAFQDAVTQNGAIPIHEALFQASQNMYKTIPLEVSKDPFAI